MSIPTVIWLAVTQTAIFYGATFWGIVHGGAALASVLANSDPLFVAVLAVMFLGEHLTSRQRLGLVFGFGGVACAVCSQGLWPPHPTVAAGIVVVGALSWAVGTIVAAGAVRKDSHPASLAAWQMTVGAVMLAVLSPVGGHSPVPSSARDVGLVLFLGVVCSALPTALFYFALRIGVASELSAWFFLVPIIGVATAWPLLGEAVTVPLGHWAFGRLGRALVGASASRELGSIPHSDDEQPSVRAAVILVLSGGTGGSKMVDGVARVVGDANLVAIVNTGDDADFYGLRVCPDLDICTYVLAGTINPRGWGFEHDSFRCLEGLATYGLESWFGLGDRDLATHIFRTLRLGQGAGCTRSRAEICAALGVEAQILPMSDDPVRTRITTRPAWCRSRNTWSRAGRATTSPTSHSTEWSMPGRRRA